MFITPALSVLFQERVVRKPAAAHGQVPVVFHAYQIILAAVELPRLVVINIAARLVNGMMENVLLVLVVAAVEIQLLVVKRVCI